MKDIFIIENQTDLEYIKDSVSRSMESIATVIEDQVSCDNEDFKDAAKAVQNLLKLKKSMKFAVIQNAGITDKKGKKLGVAIAKYIEAKLPEINKIIILYSSLPKPAWLSYPINSEDMK